MKTSGAAVFATWVAVGKVEGSAPKVHVLSTNAVDSVGAPRPTGAPVGEPA